jgi:hypothetical protein
VWPLSWPGHRHLGRSDCPSRWRIQALCPSTWQWLQGGEEKGVNDCRIDIAQWPLEHHFVLWEQFAPCEAPAHWHDGWRLLSWVWVNAPRDRWVTSLWQGFNDWHLAFHHDLKYETHATNNKLLGFQLQKHKEIAVVYKSPNLKCSVMVTEDGRRQSSPPSNLCNRWRPGQGHSSSAAWMVRMQQNVCPSVYAVDWGEDGHSVHTCHSAAGVSQNLNHLPQGWLK